MRVFVAIELPEAVQERLAQVQGDLAVGRHVPAENLHVTLAFLDHQDAQTVTALHQALAEIQLPAFDLRISGVDVFDRRAPKLVFGGVEKTTPLVALRDKVRSAAQDAGIDLRRERFRPHVTLVRFRRSMPVHDLDRVGMFLETHGDLSIPAFAVKGFALYRSILHEDGAVYDKLADYRLLPADTT